MPKTHSIRYNFLMNFILTSSNFIFPLISFPYVSRVLMASGNGKVAFAASAANYFMLVASLGIPTYGVRACAQVRDDKDELSRTVQELLFINLVTTTIVVVLYVTSIILVPKFAAERELFIINGVSIVLNMFGMNWLYQALEQYDYITARSVGFKLVSLVLMFLFVHSTDDYVIYGAISVFAAVGSNILNIYRSRYFISYQRYESYRVGRHLRPILLLFAQTVAVSIYSNLDIVMLGFLREPDQVGFYNASMRIKSILLSLVTSLANVLLPRMSYYVKEGLHDKFILLMGKALRFTLLLSFSVCSVFFFFAEESMLVLAGSGYLGAVPAMQAAVLAVIPNGLTGVLGIQVLVPLQRERDLLHSVVVGAIVDFVLNLFMIPTLGATGAAISTVIAETSVLVFQMVCCRSLLREATWRAAATRYAVTAVVLIVPIAFAVKQLHLLPFFALAIGGPTFVASYALALALLHDSDVCLYLGQAKEFLQKRGLVR